MTVHAEWNANMREVNRVRERLTAEADARMAPIVAEATRAYVALVNAPVGAVEAASGSYGEDDAVELAARVLACSHLEDSYRDSRVLQALELLRDVMASAGVEVR